MVTIEELHAKYWLKLYDDKGVLCSRMIDLSKKFNIPLRTIQLGFTCIEQRSYNYDGHLLDIIKTW